MPRRFPALAPFALVLTVTACTPHSLTNIPVPAIGSTRLLNLPYGPDPRHKLDVYTPTKALKPGAPPRPLVIFFYGGYWQSGDRADYAFAAYSFESAGYVAAVPDYRLYPHVRFPAFLDDAARAVAYLHAHAADFGADPTRIVLAGHSAGAYIAAMLNADPAYLEKYHVPRDHIRAVVTLAAPLYFTPIKGDPMRSIFSPDPAVWPETQPATFVTAPDPDRAPMLLIQGGRDQLVTPDQPRRFADLLRAHQTPATPIVYPRLTHTDVLANLIWPVWYTTDIRPQILHFIARHTRPE